MQFKHPNFSPEKLEKILLELFDREYEELGPSVFRILENQLMGYEFLKDSDNPLFRARAKEHLRMCHQTYPLLKTGIRKAPSLKVKRYLIELQEQVESKLRISAFDRAKKYAVPLLYYYTNLVNRIHFMNQPRKSVIRY